MTKTYVDVPLWDDEHEDVCGCGCWPCAYEEEQEDEK